MASDMTVDVTIGNFSSLAETLWFPVCFLLVLSLPNGKKMDFDQTKS